MAADLARVEAVRDALGTGGRIRVDANGAWDVDTAVAAIRELDRAAGGLEYVEQPCASVEDLAAVRRRVAVPIAADESIRRAADPYRVRDLEAADIAVLKVQPLGGVRACLRIAEDIGLPVVVSSALETSLGLAAGVALAAALPSLEHACGLATRSLLTADVATPDVVPVDGVLRGRRTHGRAGPDGRLRRRARPGRLVGGPAGGGPGRAEGWPPVTSSTELGRAVVGRLLESGIREIVLAPGSRNAPLAFAAYDAAEAGLVRLHTRLDERSAGFLALGLTKVGSPAAVICTSGTAVANLHPAMLEAAHAGVPLVAVTADRPERLRGTDANQTTDQIGIFGPLIPTVDLGTVEDVRHGLGPTAAADRHGPPLHLNVRLDDPLVPEDRWRPEVVPPERVGREPGWWRGPPGDTTTLAAGPRTVVVAGDDAGPPARGLAESAGWPLLAEPSSGSRTGGHAIRCYRLLLGGPLGEEIERVVVFGHPTLSRPVSRLLAREDVEVWAAKTQGLGLGRPYPVVGTFDRAEASASDPTDWFERWRDADAAVGRRPRRCYSPPSPTSRRTTSQARSREPSRPRDCSSSVRPARSATST